MPGTQQTLAVPPPVSVPTLLYGIYQSVQNGGGGGGGAPISLPQQIFVSLDGNDSTGNGTLAKPFLTGTAAYNAGITESNPFVLNFGVGSFTINLSSDWNNLCRTINGQGYGLTDALSATVIGINSSRVDVANQNGPNGYNVDGLLFNNAFVIINTSGANTTVTDGDNQTAGNAGAVSVAGIGAITIYSRGGSESPQSTDGSVTAGNGGDVNISGSIFNVGIYTNGGSIYVAGFPVETGSGGNLTCDGCNLAMSVVNTGSGSITLGRCSHASGLTITNDKGGNASY